MNNPCFAPVHAGDQSGLSPGYATGSTPFFPYVATTTHANAACGNFAAATGPLPVFTMDMGQVLAVTDLAVWLVDSAVAPFGAFNFFTDVDANYSNGATAILSGAGISFFPQPNAKVFSLGSTYTSRYFHFQPISSSPISAIGELVLNGVAVPEPGSLTLAGLACLVAGAAGRRRQVFGAK